jgi:hypothetical protein
MGIYSLLLAGFAFLIINCSSQNNPVSSGGHGSTATNTPVLNAPTPTATNTETPLCNPFYNFGKGAAGASVTLASSSEYYMTQYNLASPGMVYKLHVYVSSVPTPGANIRMALYTNSSGVPQLLVGQSSSQAAVQGWNSLDIPATVLVSGIYWVSLVSDSAINLSYDTGATNDEQDGFLGFGAFPANLSSALHHNNWDFSFYADYCIGAGTATPLPTVTNTPTNTPTITPTLFNCGGSFSFGRNYVPSGSVSLGLNSGTEFSKFILPVGGTITTLHAYILGANGDSFTMGIYTNSGSTPGSLIAASSSQAAVNGWNSFSITTSQLTAGTYWISAGTNSGTALQFALDDATNGADATDGYIEGSVIVPSTYSGGSGPNQQSFYFYGDYCVAGSSPTPVYSPTLTHTPTNTPTFTPTYTQTSSCSTSYSFGSNYVQNSTIEVDNGTWASKYTLPVAGNISELHAYVVTTNGANIQLGIYSNSGNAPGSLISSSGSQAAVVGINSFAIPATGLLPAGIYWIAQAHSQSGTGAVVYDSTGDTTDGYASSSIIPSTYSGIGPTGNSLSLWADYCVPGTSPTPVNSPTLTFTSTNTPTFTPTLTQTPSCAGSYSFGRNYVPSGGVSLGLNSGTEFSKFTMPVAGTVSELHAYVLGANGNSFTMGIYTNSGNKPGTLISTSGSQAAVNGWNNFAIPATGQLAAGTYWIAAGTNSPSLALYFALNDSTLNADATDGYIQGFSVIPSTFSGSGPNQQSFYFYGDYCVLGSSPTPANTATLTFTPTNTPTNTPTVTQTPVCASPSLYGFNTALGSSSTFGGGYLICTKFALASGPETIQQLQVYVTSNPADVRMAIYTDNGGTPGSTDAPLNLLTQSNSQVVTVGGYNTFQVPGVVLSAPATYWIAVVHDNFGSGMGLSYRQEGSPALQKGYELSSSFGPFPSTMSGGAEWDETIAVGGHICP